MTWLFGRETSEEREMRFLIQKIVGSSEETAISAESATLIDMLNYRAWLSGGDDTDYRHEITENPDGYEIGDVPIGSVEFVNGHLLNHGFGKLTHETIPQGLRQPYFLGREVLTGKWEEVQALPGDEVFVKPGRYPKSFEAMTLGKNAALLPTPLQKADEPLFLSEVLHDIASEWRVFVRRGDIMDLRPYSYDAWPVVPDESMVRQMIDAYIDAPPAYALDVAVLGSGRTVLIEVHDFIAIGLYGFESPALPAMYASAWHSYLRKSNVQYEQRGIW